MKSAFRFILNVLFFGVVVVPSPAAFTSLYVFGDGASTTTNNTYAGYHEQRFCNGRVWVEVLAQWQSLTYQSNYNWSYYGHYSQNLTNHVSTFIAPPDASNALIIVWVNNADFVNNMGTPSFGPPYDLSKLSVWTNSLNQTITNHAVAIQTLYTKGIRTLVMPNAVDLTKVPAYSGLNAANKTFIRQRTLEFNTRFTQMLSNANATLPGLKIVQPDVFTLLDTIYANPTNFGLIVPPLNATDNAIEQGYTVLNGPGANFMFWDDLHPTAKFQMYIADKAQQLLSMPFIKAIAADAGTNLLSLANVAVGRNGFVEASTNFLNWTTAQSITSSNVTQTILVPASEPLQFYRLRFPFAWAWP